MAMKIFADILLCAFFIGLACTVGCFILLGSLWLVEKFENPVVDGKKDGGDL